MDYENIIYKPTNREKVYSHRLGFAWCYKCDMAYIPVTKRCFNCRAKPEKRTFKIKGN